MSKSGPICLCFINNTIFFWGEGIVVGHNGVMIDFVPCLSSKLGIAELSLQFDLSSAILESSSLFINCRADFFCMISFGSSLLQ